MRPHHVQHIITPTGSIPNAHNAYLRIPDMQRHSQNEEKFRLHTNNNRVFIYFVTA